MAEVLAQGGSSVVYRRDAVAVKVLRDELRAVPGVLERLNNEAAVASLVQHPNVVRVHGSGDGWLEMELIDGPSMRELAPLPAPRASALVAQVAAGLDAVHATGYVHRDVKPGNVLVDRGERAVLIDFALARRMDSDEPWTTDDGHWLGTPEFAAPEQIRGLPMDARSDVYALGGLLHWALTGEVPFPRASAEATMRAHLSDPAPVVHPVVARAMAKDPAERYPTAGDLARALAG